MTAGRRSPQIETGKRQPGRSEVDMAVHETRRDEAIVEIDDVGTGELAATHVVATEPDHDTAADRHRGGVGMGRAVNPTVDQQRCGDVSHAYGVADGLLRLAWRRCGP